MSDIKTLAKTYRASEADIRKAFATECLVIIDGSKTKKSAIGEAVQFKALRDAAGVDAVLSHGYASDFRPVSPCIHTTPIINTDTLKFIAGLPELRGYDLLYFAWLTVLARNLLTYSPVMRASYPIMDFMGAWEEVATRVANNPESTARFLGECDKALDGQTFVLVCDLTPFAGEDVDLQYKVARSLLQVALRAKNYKNIRVKVILTPEMLEGRYPFDFPDASKLRADEVALPAGN